MISRASPTFQTLPNGLEVSVNDHVFVAAPYDDRGGDPYNIGRIQEFLPDLQQVRVNFYIRPRDIGTRMAQHGRRLLCTMHSDVVPVHFVRGTCTVIHRDNIPNQDEESYRKQPDCFYFNQYYDRYLHRYFDVIPVERVRNAPEHVLRFLVEHFTYILCENSYVSDLCDVLASCESCQKPAAYANSVSCEVCSKHFHLKCLNPPLPAKPKKGFGFTCAPCYHRQEQEYEEYLEGKRSTPPPTSKSHRFKGKAKATTSVPATEAGEVRLFNGWPWRYYGLYTLPEDVLDPHESLYPRAASRLGPKYQTVVPEDKSVPVASTSRFKNPPIARGEDSEVEVISKPPPADDPELDEFLDNVKKLPLYQVAGVSLLNQALLRWQADPSAAWAAVQKLSKREFRITNWSPADIAHLDEGLEEVGDDIAELRRFVPNKTLQELVNYVYIRRPAINNRVDTKHEEDKFAGAVVTGIATSRDADEVAEADLETESRAPTPPPRSKKRLGPCSLCEAKESDAWWRCPGQTGTMWSNKEKLLCSDCSTQWRHYANDHLIVEDSRNRNRNGKPKPKEVQATPADAAALSSMLSPQSSLTPEPPDPPKPVLQPRPCVLCKRNDPRTTLAQCQRCSICCHTGCAALDPETELDEWLCELCTETCRPEQRPTVMASSDTPAQFRAREMPRPDNLGCALCPPTLNQPLTADKPNLSGIDLYRKTEFNNLVHYVCAVWHPEIKFPNPLQPVIAEGVCNIPLYRRRSQECVFCHTKDVGALVQCADCNVWFHVGCAWSASCRFGFEIVAVVSKKKKDGEEPPVIMEFKDSTGLMLPRIWCKAHKLDETRRNDRSTYELGEKDPETRMTTLMTYLKYYKAASSSDDASLLMKGRSVDAWIWPALSEGSPDDPKSVEQTHVLHKAVPHGPAVKAKKHPSVPAPVTTLSSTTKRRTTSSRKASLVANAALAKATESSLDAVASPAGAASQPSQGQFNGVSAMDAAGQAPSPQTERERTQSDSPRVLLHLRGSSEEAFDRSELQENAAPDAALPAPKRRKQNTRGRGTSRPSKPTSRPSRTTSLGKLDITSTPEASAGERSSPSSEQAEYRSPPGEEGEREVLSFGENASTNVNFGRERGRSRVTPGSNSRPSSRRPANEAASLDPELDRYTPQDYEEGDAAPTLTAQQESEQPSNGRGRGRGRSRSRVRGGGRGSNRSRGGTRRRGRGGNGNGNRMDAPFSPRANEAAVQITVADRQPSHPQANGCPQS